jgi:hypothetical protein
MRRTEDNGELSREQWPKLVREQADDFADRLVAHGFAPPVVSFTQWADLWSMGDLFSRWLTPPDGPPPLLVHGERVEIYGYVLPDAGQLAQFLATAGPQQFKETDWFIHRLRDAVCSSEKLVDRAVLVVLRHVVGPTVLDNEITASLKKMPDWLSE